jgi:5-methylcytosine-specific restriction endonuclease McrA
VKVCSRCGEEKPREEFHKDSSRNGLRSHCKSCHCKSSRLYCEANAEQRRESCRRYYEANAEQRREYSRSWAKNNPGKHNAKVARRKALKLKATPPGPPCPRVRALYEIAACFNKDGYDVHVDHIVPLSKGGLHVFENLRIIPAVENLRKGAKLPA